MTFKNPDFDRAYNVAQWLVGRFNSDPQLLLEYMGGSTRPMLDAVSQVEREAHAKGWARIDVEDALRRLQHS